MKRFFSAKTSPLTLHLGLLILRVGLGILMIPHHGWPKLANFAERKDTFMDFMGLGSAISLGLVVFAEFFCSILLILGLFTRAALIPLIITMLVVLGTNGWLFFGKHELATAFLMGYTALFFMGPGKYSIDGGLFKK